MTRWVGVRKNSQEKKRKPKPVYISYIWTFVGAFGGLACLQAIFGHATYFIERGVPPLVASYVRLLSSPQHAFWLVANKSYRCNRVLQRYSASV